MAKISGKIVYIYPTQQLQSKSGNAFYKRDFVIAVQSFDRDTGEPTIDEDNIPMLSLTGDRCSQLDTIRHGDIVTVDFYLRGRRYRGDDGKERIITDINVTAVRPCGRTASISPVPTASPAPDTPTAPNPGTPEASDSANPSVPPPPENDLPF